MKVETFKDFTLYDHEPAADSFREEVISGLSKIPKRLPCKYFYDERGSRLFDEICGLEEYYPTRTETGILEDNISEITSLLGSDCLVVEFGSGFGIKTRMLLDNLVSPAAYIPIDIDKSVLISSTKQLRDEYPELEVLPVCADFNGSIKLPPVTMESEKTVAFFPGSTIGNFLPSEAVRFMKNVATLCGEEGGLLLGVDTKKDVEILERAYNDSEGVTAEFNLNLMTRIKNEFDADFSLDSFTHQAVYNQEHGRIEMHLVSREEQVLGLDDASVELEKGERIITEYSYKYERDDFERLADEAGFSISNVWVDENNMFSVQYLRVKPSSLNKNEYDSNLFKLSER